MGAKRPESLVCYIATNMKIILNEECFSLWFKCSYTPNIKLYAPAMLITDPDLGLQAILFPRFILIKFMSCKIFCCRNVN